MAIVIPTSSMDGESTNSNTVAVFIKASNGSTSLGELAGGTSSNFAKIGLMQDVADNKEATVTKRESENSKVSVKTIAQKKDRSIVVNAQVGTAVAKCCYHGYIADYDSAAVDIPDDATGFTGEAILVYLDEDETWDEVASLAHNGIEYWKSVRIIANGGQSYDSGGSQLYPFEVHLQRDSSGESVRTIPANDASGIDVTEDYVDFSSITS